MPRGSDIDGTAPPGESAQAVLAGPAVVPESCLDGGDSHARESNDGVPLLKRPAGCRPGPPPRTAR